MAPRAALPNGRKDALDIAKTLLLRRTFDSTDALILAPFKD